MTSAITANLNLPSASAGAVAITTALNQGSGGGGTPVSTTETRWSNRAGTNAAQTTGNWYGAGAPSDGTLEVIMGEISNAACVIPNTGSAADFYCLTFDATGYTGDIHRTGATTAYIYVAGDCTLEGSAATAGTTFVTFMGSGSLTTDGFFSVGIIAGGIVGASTTATITFADNVACHKLYTQDATVPNINSRTLTFSNASLAATGGILHQSTAAMLYTSGKLLVTAAAATVPVRGVSGSGALAPLEMSAGCFGITTDIVNTMVSLTQAGGVWDGASSGAIQTIGSYAGTGGSISGVRAIVSGTNTAANMTITNSDFSGGTALDASTGCTNGGGNTNVTFPIVYVWNHLLTYGGTYTYSNSNKTLATSGARKCACGTISRSDQIRAFEITTADHWGNSSFGIVRDDATLSAGAVGFTGAVGNSIGNYQNEIFKNGTSQGGFGDIGMGDGVPCGYIIDFVLGRMMIHGTLTNNSGWFNLPAGWNGVGRSWYPSASYIDAGSASITINQGTSAFSTAFQTLLTSLGAVAWNAP